MIINQRKSDLYKKLHINITGTDVKKKNLGKRLAEGHF